MHREEEACQASERGGSARILDRRADLQEVLRPGPRSRDPPDVLDRFPTTVQACESYGHNVATGAPTGATRFLAERPDGRALLKTAPYEPAFETPDEQYPLRLTTGRTAYHWHTRTKTKRAPELQGAAPDMWVELSEHDARSLGVSEGDVVQVTSRRGSIEAPARISHIREGVVFAPWHYGSSTSTAANELTIFAWDPVSKQPELKVAAVSVRRLRPGDGPAPAPTGTASAPAAAARTQHRKGE